MNKRVNLLPAIFEQRRARRRRVRRWVVICSLLAAAQGMMLFFVQDHVRDVRRYQSRLNELAESNRQDKKVRDDLKGQRDILQRDVQLAERMGDKHLWSRWLGSLSIMLPSQVTMISIQTEPAQLTETASYAGATSPRSVVKSADAVKIQGSALRHEDLIGLLKALNGMKTFQSVRLEEARRDKQSGRESIGFTIVCEW